MREYFPGFLSGTPLTQEDRRVRVRPGLWPGPRRQARWLLKSHPCRLSGMLVLVEDAAEAVPCVDVEPGGGVRLGDR